VARRKSPFAAALAERQAGRAARARAWVFVPYDQLSDRIGLLAERDPREVGILLVEHPGKAARRPYHRQKLALVLANLRQFALEQAARGVAVRHVVADAGGYAGAVEALAREVGPVVVHEPAERELRVELARVPRGLIAARPHDGWLTTRAQFDRAAPAGPPWRMDAFYRLVRRDTGILMEGGKPAGGKLSFDVDNRKPWRGEPPAPAPPTFVPDEVTREVGALVERAFASHPGQLDLSTLPATAADAERLWAWALASCLPWFGPYEDAMSTRSTGLFHTRISPLLNLHRLLPERVVADALAAPLPLACQEGFVRQILGWREFVRHVHVATDGFRDVPGLPASDAAPSFLGADRPLPPAYWGAPSGLACLDRVVADVWREGWSHHITRLMVLGNLATLLDVSPRELTDWFWVAYVDAFDWVVEPNVLAMATFGVGDVMTTKPYIAGAAYIDRMSDHCDGCRFDPARDCPVTPLYWAFLARHEDRLRDNPRMRVPLAALRRRPAARRVADVEVYERVAAALAAGRAVEPR
jgi:deoxyribodipyrimidine photolyase-related protein